MTRPSPNDLEGAWRAAWQYADDHAESAGLTPEAVAWAAFLSIADAVDGDDAVPPTLHGLQSLSGGAGRPFIPDFSREGCRPR